MDRPVRLSFVLVAVYVTAVAAQDASPLATASPISEPAAAERAVSPHVAELLAASIPKFRPPAPAEKKSEPAEPTNHEGDKPANGIVRLPRYVVRESALPTPLEVMTKRELEHYAMDRYLGPEDGFDRGFLNLFTIAGLWKKIPVLGQFPFVGSETNEDRALRLFDIAERKRKMEELSGLMNLTKEAGDAVGSDKIKQEADQTFIRHMDIGR
jgi:hypothetical protein